MDHKIGSGLRIGCNLFSAKVHPKRNTTGMLIFGEQFA